MRVLKERLTVTVDPELVRAGNAAVAEGRAESLSAWVNLALGERRDREQRLRALAAAVEAFEARFGELGSEEVARQQRTDRAGSRVLVRRRAGRTRPAKS
jgi:hypothetical protein